MKIRPNFIAAFVLALVALAYFAVGGKTPNKPTTTKLPVVTSFYPLYYLATQIGGDKAEVYNITPAGAEPHDYEPTTQDMARIEDSKLLIINGGKLEAWGDRVRNNLGNTKVVAAVGETLVNQQINEGGVMMKDPHVWLSPALIKKEAVAIADSFKRADPANAAFYTANAAVLVDKLNTLDQEYRNSLSRCADKNIVTSHAAFGYLARDYGLTQVAISGLSPDAEPTVQKLAETADFVKKNNVKYIFFESLVSPKLAETIAEETGAKTLPLNPLEGLTDQEISSGQNYFSVMRGNLENLKVALSCK